MAAVLGAAKNVVFKERSRESIPLGTFAGWDGICQATLLMLPAMHPVTSVGLFIIVS